MMLPIRVSQHSEILHIDQLSLLVDTEVVLAMIWCPSLNGHVNGYRIEHPKKTSLQPMRVGEYLYHVVKMYTALSREKGESMILPGD
jgi:hypothetical protein